MKLSLTCYNLAVKYIQILNSRRVSDSESTAIYKNKKKKAQVYLDRYIATVILES